MPTTRDASIRLFSVLNVVFFAIGIALIGANVRVSASCRLSCCEQQPQNTPTGVTTAPAPCGQYLWVTLHQLIPNRGPGWNSLIGILCGLEREVSESVLQAWTLKYRRDLSDAVPNAAILIVVIAGALLVAASIFACFGVICASEKRGPAVMYSYAFIVVLLALVQLVAAGILLAAVRRMRRTRDDSDFEDDGVERFVDDSRRDCCLRPDRTCWIPDGSDIVSFRSCLFRDVFEDRLLSWVLSHVTPIGWSVVALSALQLMAAAGVCYIARSQEMEDDSAGNDNARSQGVEENSARSQGATREDGHADSGTSGAGQTGNGQTSPNRVDHVGDKKHEREDIERGESV